MPVPDFSPGEVLTAAAMDSIGLWKVAAISATSGSSLIVDGVFTANFTNYRLVFSDVSGAANAGTFFRYRSGGSTISLGNYYGIRVGFTYSTGVLQTAGDSAASSHFAPCILEGTTAKPSTLTIDVFSPQKSTVMTSTHMQGTDARTSGRGAFSYSGFYNATTAMDGFVISPTSGNYTNIDCVVYGYRG